MVPRMVQSDYDSSLDQGSRFVWRAVGPDSWLHIFFLLVFFMMNSLQTVAQKALSVQLPQATSASAPAQLPVVLTLDAEGHITIDNKPMSIDDAEAMVKQRIQENPNASVILQADKRAAHGQVVAIMDMLKQSGVKRLAIAAEQKG